MAAERLRQLSDGRLLYELRHRWRDGTTHVAFETPCVRRPSAGSEQSDEDRGGRDSAAAVRTSRPARYYTWAELMRRVFKVDVLRCPRCKATPMRILAAIPPPTRAQPLSPARTDTSDWSLAEPA